MLPIFLGFDRLTLAEDYWQKSSVHMLSISNHGIVLISCPYFTKHVFVYQPRNPKASAYYRCVEDHFEQLETVWDERYQRRFGFWRPYVMDVIQRYLASGS
jgi:hypothetical protein